MKSIIAATILALSTIAPTVSAHGYVQNVILNGNTFTAFLPFQDNYDPKPSPKRITRHIPDDGPVTDFNSKSIVCNVGAQDASQRTTSHGAVPAGGDVTFRWDRWPTDHHGPVTTYMASCGTDCSNFDATGNVWFKIDQLGLVSGTTDTGTWASDVLIANNISWTVTIPPKLKSGAYLIRHEILALHSAGAPQFYPHCSQLVVTGSGTATPSSSELVAIPGIYKNDQSTMINIWNNGQTKYTIAGPAVTKIGAYTTTNSKNKLGGGAGPIPFKAGKILSGNAVTSAIGSTGENVASGNNAGTTTTKAATTTTKAATTTKANTTKASVAAASTTPVKSCKVSTKKRNASKAAKRHAKKRLSTDH
jgi:hypothetical protein